MSSGMEGRSSAIHVTVPPSRKPRFKGDWGLHTATQQKQSLTLSVPATPLGGSGLTAWLNATLVLVANSCLFSTFMLETYKKIINTHVSPTQNGNSAPCAMIPLPMTNSNQRSDTDPSLFSSLSICYLWVFFNLFFF